MTNLNADLLDGVDASSFATAADLQTILESFFHEVRYSRAGEFEVPRGVHRLEVTVIGGGGGGGGGFYLGGQDAGGGGGGAGVVVVTAVDVLQGETLSITVGEGGAGSSHADASSEGDGEINGHDGETSVLRSVDRPWRVEAAGGKGGASGFFGGTGGDGSFGGGGGGYGQFDPPTGGGTGIFADGAGGDSAGVGGAGASGGAGQSGCTSFSLSGGGGGGGPGGGDGDTGDLGGSGIQPGAGGGGACANNDSRGGDGAPGTIVIRWVGLPEGR